MFVDRSLKETTSATASAVSNGGSAKVWSATVLQRQSLTDVVSFIRLLPLHTDPARMSILVSSQMTEQT